MNLDPAVVSGPGQVTRARSSGRVGVRMSKSRAAAGLGLWLIGLTTAAPCVAGEPVDFAGEVAPLLVERCLSCHNAGKAGGGLDLSTPKSVLAGGEGGPAVVPGRPDEGSLLEMIAP